MIRTVEQWKRILEGMFPKDAAKQILGDLTHYPAVARSHYEDDKQQLANALMAFASLQSDD